LEGSRSAVWLSCTSFILSPFW